MRTVENTKQQWQDLAFESFFNMVKAADGDFEAIDRLANSLNDSESLTKTIDVLSQNPQAKQAFLTRPCLGNVDLQKLHQLDRNTLGYVYANHMISNALNPLQAKAIDNDIQFFISHITETHDLWHVVTGCNTNILGEIQLEAFYVAQLYASRFWLALLTKNLLKAVVCDIEVASQYMDAISQGWMMGQQAKPLFGIQWNSLWETPLQDIRASLNLDKTTSDRTIVKL